MAEHNLLGKAGEDAAVDYLERHDYVIRHRNWRKGHFDAGLRRSKNPKRYGLRTSSRRRHSTKNQAHCNSSRYIYQVIPNR